MITMPHTLLLPRVFLIQVIPIGYTAYHYYAIYVLSPICTLLCVFLIQVVLICYTGYHDYIIVLILDFFVIDRAQLCHLCRALWCYLHRALWFH